MKKIKEDAIIKVAFAENPMDANEAKKKGRLKKGKVLSLIERLQNTRVKSVFF